MTQNAKTQKRIGWVDIAKAISITAIVIGHFAAFFSASIPWAHNLLEFCYSFHVPLFFILSGFTSKPGLIPPKKLLRLTRTIFLPYIVTGLIIILVYYLSGVDNTLEEMFAGLAYGHAIFRSPTIIGEPFGVIGIGAIWFLPALYFGKLFSAGISRLHPILRILAAAALITLGEASEGIVTLPFGLQSGCCAAWYVTCGMMMSEYKLFEKEGWEKNFLAVLSLLGMIYIILLTSGTIAEPNYCLSLYRNGAFDIAGTVLASLVIMEIAMLLDSWDSIVQKVVRAIGRSTLPIFCWHAVTIAPDSVLVPWLSELAATGQPEVIFFISLVIDFVLIGIATSICRVVPGLKHIYFPSAQNLFEKEYGDPALNALAKSKTVAKTAKNRFGRFSR